MKDANKVMGRVGRPAGYRPKWEKAGYQIGDIVRVLKECFSFLRIWNRMSVRVSIFHCLRHRNDYLT